MSKIKIGNLIVYNFLYSNEKDKIGIVCDIKKDSNFKYIIDIFSNSEIDHVPYTVMEFEKID